MEAIIKQNNLIAVCVCLCKDRDKYHVCFGQLFTCEEMCTINTEETTITNLPFASVHQ